MNKARSIQKWFVEIGVEKLDWPAQSPDLNPIGLWDELECRLRARTNCPTSVPDLTNALVAEWKQIPQQCPNISWKAFPEERRLL